MLIKKKMRVVLVMVSGLILFMLLALTPKITSAISGTPLELKYTNGLELDPTTFKIELTKGEIYRGSVNITNTNDDAITIKAYIKPFTGVSYGDSDRYDYMDFDIQTSQSKIVDWTSILNNKDSEITIEAGETRVLNFIIDTPNEAQSGSQDEVIFIEPTQSNKDIDIRRVGIIISANIAESIPLQLILGIAIAILIPFILIIVYIICRSRKSKKPFIKKKGVKNGGRRH